MVRFSFAGQELAALPGGALYWAAHKALILADLHFEKASWFATGGQMLPPYDTHATLAEIAALVEATGAESIWCLGDSFHDDAGPERMGADARAMLEAMTARTDWVWITGNHDAGLVTRCGGRVMEEAMLGGHILRHRAEPDEAAPELSGHWHPKLRVRIKGQSVARRCFVMGATRLILPAFGSLTGGLDAAHPEIMTAVGGDAVALVPVGERLLRFQLDGCSPRSD